MARLNVVKKEDDNMEISTIATSAVLLDVNISIWTGRKRDKKTTEEVTQSKNAGSTKAASVIKNLMSDDTDLDKIRAYAQDTRLYVLKHTITWTDGGTRLLPTKLIFEVTNELDSREVEFHRLVEKFVDGYSLKVSAAAFKLGQLFDRNEYPDAQDVKNKFAMRYIMSPVPMSGDFRVDVQKDTAKYLKEQYEKAAMDRVSALMREPWERAYEHLAHIKERMEAALAYEFDPLNPDGRRAPKLFQSMIDNGMEQANLLDKLNVANDPQLKDCAARMRRMLSNMDIKSIRESKDQQESVKKQVEEIINDFNNFTL